MEDRQIVELYWNRSEEAIARTAEKYGSYLSRIAYRILQSWEDTGECVNDTYIRAWNLMPPHKPELLSAFLGKITRRVSIDRWRREHADKRGGGAVPLALEELKDCVSGRELVEEEVQRRELAAFLDAWLGTLPSLERRIFLRRYWYLEPVQDIARAFELTPNRVSAMLCRTRKKLRNQLEREGLL